MNKLTGTQMAEQFSDFVNMSTHDKDEFSKAVTNEHRHLQQEMFNSMLKCIEGWRTNEILGYYDARNEYAVKASKAMIQGLMDAGMW
jgi:hypothetical protein